MPGHISSVDALLSLAEAPALDAEIRKLTNMLRQLACRISQRYRNRDNENRHKWKDNQNRKLKDNGNT